MVIFYDKECNVPMSKLNRARSNNVYFYARLLTSVCKKPFTNSQQKVALEHIQKMRFHALHIYISQKCSIDKFSNEVCFKTNVCFLFKL